MTREEFAERVTGWYALIDFCQEYGCEECDEVYSDDARDAIIDGYVSELISDYRWYRVRDTLADYETGYDYWLRDGDDWNGLSQADFEEWKLNVSSWADGNGVWDDEEPEAEEDEDGREEEDCDDVCPFQIEELIGAGNDCVVAIERKKLDAIREANEMFATLIPCV